MVLVIGMFFVSFVSAGLFGDTLEEKVSDREYIEELRTQDITEEGNSWWIFNSRWFSYFADEKRVVVEDKDNLLINFTMLTPYVNNVTEGNDTLIAEFELHEFHKDAKDWIKGIRSFDVKSEYGEVAKTFISKYAVDYEEEVCFDIDLNLTYCENITQTNWVQFKDLKELPSNTSQRVGLFTNTVFGESIEWIPEIFGFEVLQFAEWDVTSGTKFEFDTVQAIHNSVVQINDTHYLVTYRGASNFGNAVVLVVDGTTITKPGVPYIFYSNLNSYNSLVQINETHYLNVYTDAVSDGWAVVLVVDGLTITSGTHHEFDGGLNSHNSIKKINDTHYINAYTGNGNDGFAVVLVVDGTTVTSPTSSHEFDASNGLHTGLTKLNNTNFLVAYAGPADDGFAKILIVDGTTITSPGSSLEFDLVQAWYNAPVTLSETKVVNAYSGFGQDGFAVVLNIDGTTITAGTPFEFDLNSGNYMAAAKIDSTHIITTHQGASFDGFSHVLEIDGDTITSLSEVEFDTLSASYNSLVQMNDTHYLNAYAGSGNDGFAIVLVVEVPVTPTDSCTYSSGNWEVDCSDNCSITSNIDVGENNISILGIGVFTTTANITNFKELLIAGNSSSLLCEVTCLDGGCFK